MVETRRNASKVGKNGQKIAHFFRFFGLNFFQRHFQPSNRARYVTYRNRRFFSKKKFSTYAQPTQNTGPMKMRISYAKYGISQYTSKKSYRYHQFIVEILFLSKKHMKIHKINNELSFCCLSMIGFALGFLSIKSNLKLISILFLIIY